MISILDFGAVSDGKTLNTKAFADAIAAAKETKETVCVPAGTYLTGTVNLQGVSLYLEAGAVILGSPDLNDYPVQDYVHNEMGPLRALIVNLGHDHVSVTGAGTIDLNGTAFYDTTKMNIPPYGKVFTKEQEAECTYYIGKRPGQCIFFYDSKDILLSGITILNAPCWTISINSCENVRLLGLEINTHLNVPNDDGIHIASSKSVVIANCRISSGDDCIALSCITDWTRPCEDIVITNCVLRSCSKAIVIGYIYSVVRNVLISNCIIKESNRGLTIMCHDECGLVENIRVSNCIVDTKVRAGNWWGNGEPIAIMAVPQDKHLPKEQKPERTIQGACVRNIHFTGITCMGENAMGIVGVNGNVENVTLRDIDYTRKPSANLPLKGYRFDLAPSDIVCDIPLECGLKIVGAKNVRLENVNTGVWTIENESI